MYNKGFTLVELIIVIAITGIIASVTFPYISSYYSRQQLDVTSEEVINNLRRAQNKAIINQQNERWGVYWTIDEYYIFKGDSYSSGQVDETFKIPTNIVISGSEIVFDQLTGKTTPSTITITFTTINEQKQVTINSEGKIAIQ